MNFFMGEGTKYTKASQLKMKDHINIDETGNLVFGTAYRNKWGKLDMQMSGDTDVIQNAHIKEKTEAVQSEFDELMAEMMERRAGGGLSRLHVSKFTDILEGMYLPTAVERHESPTKRLIQHKDSTWDHKARVTFGQK